MSSTRGDQLLEERVERFLLGLGQRQQEPLLVGDMAADRLVDQTLARVGQHDQFAATVLGVGSAPAGHLPIGRGCKLEALRLLSYWSTIYPESSISIFTPTLVASMFATILWPASTNTSTDSLAAKLLRGGMSTTR